MFSVVKVVSSVNYYILDFQEGRSQKPGENCYENCYISKHLPVFFGFFNRFSGIIANMLLRGTA